MQLPRCLFINFIPIFLCKTHENFFHININPFKQNTKHAVSVPVYHNIDSIYTVVCLSFRKTIAIKMQINQQHNGRMCDGDGVFFCCQKVKYSKKLQQYLMHLEHI